MFNYISLTLKVNVKDDNGWTVHIWSIAICQAHTSMYKWHRLPHWLPHEWRNAFGYVNTNKEAQCMLYENTQCAKCKEFMQVSHNIERYQKQTHSHRPPSQKVSKYLDFLVLFLPPNQQFLETTESSVPLRHGSTAHPGFVTWNPRWERSMDDVPHVPYEYDRCSQIYHGRRFGPI